MNELEYIIETKSEKEWQKQLNQWRNDYEINVISMINANNPYETRADLHQKYVTICLTRKKKINETY